MQKRTGRQKWKEKDEIKKESGRQGNLVKWEVFVSWMKLVEFVLVEEGKLVGKLVGEDKN